MCALNLVCTWFQFEQYIFIHPLGKLAGQHNCGQLGFLCVVVNLPENNADGNICCVSYS